MIEWFARNPVAANLLMITIIVVGVLSASRSIPLEVFPSFEIQSVTVRTAFRGATPRTIEDGITNRVEEAIYDLEGIKEISSRSSEGLSTVVAQIEESYDKREILNDIKLRIDALNTLPRDAEKTVVSLSSVNPGVIQIAVLGDVDYKTLRLTTDRVREDLLLKPDITLVDLLGVTPFEVSVEITPQVLDNFNLTLAMVAAAIRQGAVDVSAGNVKTRDGDILVRTDGQAYTRDEFANIPIINSLGGDPILLGEIASIEDGFEDQPLLTKFNGKPAVMMEVRRTGQQSSIEIAKIVRDYIDDFNARSNGEITLNYWDDDSKLLKQRLSTLVNSGIYGGILVLLVLSLFLRPAIAFWVFLGVPVSFMGAFIFMPHIGGTFNIISLFAFITVLGIVVDDAIVTGENIYSKMRDGLEPLQASIIGTKEIAIPVTFGILTTIVAFYPMTNLGANRTGFIAAQIPMVVIPVLLFSLIESKLVLPSHLSHIKPRSEDAKSGFLSNMQIQISRGFENSVTSFYRPFLNKCLNNKAITLSALIAISSIILTYAATGHLKFTFFPRVESEEIKFELVMPETTGFATTKRHIDLISSVVMEMQEKYRDPETGVSIIRHTYSTAGSTGRTVKPSIGSVRAELIGPEKRHIEIKASELAREVQSRIAGKIPGLESLSVRTEVARAGEPIDVEFSGSDPASMRIIADKVRERLQGYSNVFDIKDNYSGGKEELNIDLKPQAYALGLSLADIADQVRGSVFGIQAQRIQRGRQEVRVMVRLPEQHRSSMDDLLNMPIQIGPQNDPVPLSDLAYVKAGSSPTNLHRLNRRAVLNVTADLDKQKVDVPALLRDLSQYIRTETAGQPNLKFTYKGESEERAENNAGIKSGGIVILIAIYALLAIPFKSYAQPLIIMSVIPFSMVGAILGHVLTGYDLSLLSVVGMMALLGVVVNDSLVLVDYINKQRAKGAEVFDAVLASGTARFRPVILTSVTTFAGLTPLLLDNSTQSQFLIPMALSLGFGILFATSITLLMVPINYLLAWQCKQGAKRAVKWCWARWLEYWHREDPHKLS